jgi:hypothetical protein
VAEDGVLTAGQDRRHPVAFAADLRMPDRIDPAVDRVQQAALDAPLDRARAYSDVEQLLSRDDSMLAAGQGDDAVEATCE